MEKLTYETSTEEVINLNSTSGKVQISFKNIIKIASTVFAEYDKLKQKANMLIIGGILVLIIGAFFNLRESKVAVEDEVFIYPSAWGDYKMQKEKHGTIYNVKYGDDGRYYHKKNFVIFGVFAFIGIIGIAVGASIYETEIKKFKNYYSNNYHSISVNLGDEVVKEFYVGDIDLTRKVFNELKQKWESSKMK
jgi:hypothetical protein